MMFVSLGIGTVVAVILITIVSLVTGGATRDVFPSNSFDGHVVAPYELNLLSGGHIEMPWASGHPAVLVLFASWCEPCRAEMPRVAAWVKNHDLGAVRFVGVNVNDTTSSAVAFVKKFHVGFQVVTDSSTTTSAFNIGALPDTVFVRSDGTVDQIVVGSVSNTQLRLGVSELR